MATDTATRHEIDGTVAVVHSRRLVAETLCIALRGIAIDARLGLVEEPSFALVDTRRSDDIERLTLDGVPVIAFGSADPVSIARAIRAGAAWHVGDDIGFDQVAEHLTRLAGGESAPRGTAHVGRRVAETPLGALTPREQEVLRSLVSGKRAADIADTDFVSVTTVRNQIQSILTKLGVHSQLEAVSMAVRAGWTPLAA
jgi:DNA-binding NarL/FixJ family response regulator